jgi:hypothetical protein
VVVSTSSDTSRWKVVVDGSERVQWGAGGKYGMKVGNVLECWESIEGQCTCPCQYDALSLLINRQI